jgi:uncharacterized protein (DUF885 family)
MLSIAKPICLIVFVLTFCCGLSMAQAVSPVESRRKGLNDLLAERWEYKLRTSPIMASFQGDKRWNDKLDDLSPEAIDKDLQEAQRFLVRLEAIDTSGFPEQEALNKTLMVRDLKMQLEGARFKPWEMPVDQQNGVQIWLPELVTVLSFQSVKDYEDYISRLRQIPRVLDQTITQMRKGMDDKLMPPRFLLEKVVDQCKTVASQTPEASTFAPPFSNFPKDISASDQKRLREAGLAAIKEAVLPAYLRFSAFVREEYVPKGRVEPGIWSLPDGADRYGLEIRRMTTTDMTPEEIHALGLKQVDAIEAEMLALAHKLGFKDLASLNDHIKHERHFYATSGQQLLDLYTNYVHEMEPELPKLFGRLPKNKLTVIPMEASHSKDAVPADYTDGTADGSRPGHINVNEWDPEHRLLLNVEAIAYHEGIPGHHLQLSLAMELPDLPQFRKYEDYTAFVEGWALYSERLGKEVGRYQDPYSDYGRLENEMWRAVRLVVDTGVHEKHWSRARWSLTFIVTPPWMNPMFRPKLTATSPGPHRLWPTSSDSWRFSSFASMRKTSSEQSSTFVPSTMKSSAAARSHWTFSISGPANGSINRNPHPPFFRPVTTPPAHARSAESPEIGISGMAFGG